MAWRFYLLTTEGGTPLFLCWERSFTERVRWAKCGGYAGDGIFGRVVSKLPDKEKEHVFVFLDSFIDRMKLQGVL